MKYMTNIITIFKWVKNLFVVLLGISLIIIAIFNYMKNQGLFTNANPSKLFSSYVRYYDERLLIFLLIAGCILVCYGFYSFYSDLLYKKYIKEKELEQANQR